MNPYLEPKGFLGTGASLLADVTLSAYILLLLPGMILGFYYARRGKHRPHHKWVMTLITIINWILIIFLMFAAYRFDVASNIGSQPNNTRYLLPTIHGLFGIPAQLLATFVVWRMFREDSQVRRAKARGEKDTSKYWFRRAKPVMRLTLALWLITATLGVLSYLTRYEIIPALKLNEGVAAPIATPEVSAPVETAEAPIATDELLTPVETAEAPVATEEIADSDTPTEQPSATRRAAATRTPVPPSETEEMSAPVATEELATDTPTRRPSATRRATATRTPIPPAETEALEPVETPEPEADD